MTEWLFASRGGRLLKLRCITAQLSIICAVTASWWRSWSNDVRRNQFCIQWRLYLQLYVQSANTQKNKCWFSNKQHNTTAHYKIVGKLITSTATRKVNTTICHWLLKGHSAQNCIYIFWSILKVCTIRYFSITKLFLIVPLRNNYLSPKCIGD